MHKKVDGVFNMCVSGSRSLLFLLVIAAASAPTHAALIDGLQAWWEFNAGAGTLDSSGNNRHLTLQQNPYAVAPADPAVVPGGVGSGSALQIAATADARPGFAGWVEPAGWASLPDVPGFGDVADLSGAGMALQAWVRFSMFQTDSYQSIASKASDCCLSGRDGWVFDLYTNSGGQQFLHFFARTGIGFSDNYLPVSLGVEDWYHLVVTREASLTTIYLDGSNIGELTTIGGGGQSESALALGAQWHPWDAYISPTHGALDKVAIWDRSLSQSEVLALYNDGAGFDIPGTSAASAPQTLALALAGLAALLTARRRRHPGRTAAARH